VIGKDGVLVARYWYVEIETKTPSPSSGRWRGHREYLE
jgi:hypothetical protein